MAHWYLLKSVSYTWYFYKLWKCKDNCSFILGKYLETVFRCWLWHQKGSQKNSGLHQEEENCTILHQLERLPNSNCEPCEPCEVFAGVAGVQWPENLYKDATISPTLAFKSEPLKCERAGKRSQSTWDLELRRGFKFQPTMVQTQRKSTLFTPHSQCLDLKPVNSNLQRRCYSGAPDHGWL